jgi:ring-1,2-phenylacetyl-CoA epoxidase subunit PaaE
MTAVSTIPTRRAPQVFHPLAVAAVERLCDDAVAVSFVVPDDLRTAYSFVPGQSLTIRRFAGGVEHRRSYSICAPAGAPLRVGVREIPDGSFSTWLNREVRPGDLIEVGTPTGTFGSAVEWVSGSADRVTGLGRHLCIAAGSGITPILSVAATVLAGGGEVTLLYGNRSTASVMFSEELGDLKNLHGPRLQVVHVLSREPRDVELFSGRLDAERMRGLIDAFVPIHDTDHVWLCGPLPMTAEARTLLADLGVPAERVHLELFYVDEPPPELHRVSPELAGETSEVTVVLDGLSITAAMSRGQAILDSASAVRSDLPFACKGGVCGTCRAQVTEGEVEMRRNYALDESELAQGFVLTCQSHPVSDTVVVDYDA